MYPPILLITKFAVYNNEICIKNSYYTINFISISILYKKKNGYTDLDAKIIPQLKHWKKPTPLNILNYKSWENFQLNTIRKKKLPKI